MQGHWQLFSIEIFENLENSKNFEILENWENFENFEIMEN